MAPREVTGRKPADGASRKKQPIRTPPLDELMAYSIQQFCALHGISIDTYFRMRRQGLGPATMKVLNRTLISVESAADWRRAREQAERRPVKRQVKETAWSGSQEMGAA
jgi:hypothetical protein